MKKGKLAGLAVLAAATGLAGMTVPPQPTATAQSPSAVTNQTVTKASKARSDRFRANQRLTITPLSMSSMGGFSLVGVRTGPPTPRDNQGFKRNRRAELKRSARRAYKS